MNIETGLFVRAQELEGTEGLREVIAQHDAERAKGLREVIAQHDAMLARICGSGIGEFLAQQRVQDRAVNRVMRDVLAEHETRMRKWGGVLESLAPIRPAPHGIAVSGLFDSPLQMMGSASLGLSKITGSMGPVDIPRVTAANVATAFRWRDELGPVVGRFGLLDRASAVARRLRTRLACEDAAQAAIDENVAVLQKFTREELDLHPYWYWHHVAAALLEDPWWKATDPYGELRRGAERRKKREQRRRARGLTDVPLDEATVEYAPALHRFQEVEWARDLTKLCAVQGFTERERRVVVARYLGYRDDEAVEVCGLSKRDMVAGARKLVRLRPRLRVRWRRQ